MPVKQFYYKNILNSFYRSLSSASRYIDGESVYRINGSILWYGPVTTYTNFKNSPSNVTAEMKNPFFFMLLLLLLLLLLL